MRNVVLAVVGGYILGRMAKGETAQEAVAGGIAQLKGLFSGARAALPSGPTGEPQVVEPSYRDDVGSPQRSIATMIN